MDTIPLCLLALIVAIARTPLNIYDVHSRRCGVVKAEPWRTKISTCALRVTAAWRQGVSWLWGSHRSEVIAVACLLALVAFAPHQASAGGMLLLAGHMNIDQLERDLLKKGGDAAALLEKTMKACQSHEEKDKDGKVTSTGRLMTDDEKKAIQGLIDDGNQLKARIERAKGDESMAAEIERMTAGMSAPKKSQNGQPVERRSMGQQFAESDAMAWLQKHPHGARGSAFTSPSVELMAAVLDTTTTSGGDLIVSDYRPGILPLLFKRLVVADLIAPGTTDSNTITYMKETTFTNAAAAVAEGQLKPESTLVFDQVSDSLVTIPHWLPVTEQMVEDVAQIRSYIDARLRLGVEIAEEDELLNGSGTAPHMTGLLNRTPLTTATVRSGSVTNADAIFTAMMAVFNGSFVMPTGTIMNPANWQTTQLSKDGNGRYYGSGPFAGPQAPMLWGLPVVVTPSIVANTGFTGAFNSAAQVFRKGGIRVEVSNSHSDFFIRNLLAIRAEERLALACYRPSAFSKITSLT